LLQREEEQQLDYQLTKRQADPVSVFSSFVSSLLEKWPGVFGPDKLLTFCGSKHVKGSEGRYLLRQTQQANIHSSGAV